MKTLIAQVREDVERVCRPLGVEVVYELTYGVPSRVTVQVREVSASEEACEVVLYSGAPSVVNDELGDDLDGRLVRLLSNPPYRIIEHTRGIAFGNAYKVGRCAVQHE